MEPVILDPYDHNFHWDPYPYYRAARERDPVYYYEPGGFWLLTKWDDVNQAFKDHKTFINTGAVALEKDANEKLPYPPPVADLDGALGGGPHAGLRDQELLAVRGEPGVRVQRHRRLRECPRPALPWKYLS